MVRRVRFSPVLARTETPPTPLELVAGEIKRIRGWTAAPATAARQVGAVYRPRRPTATPLYPVVQHHLETFLTGAEEADPFRTCPCASGCHPGPSVSAPS
jgi:hypothetical protein